jgi:hypothetical protein
MMLMKSADSVSDFKVVDDGGCRRVSVFGMGWTGYTLPRVHSTDVFDDPPAGSEEIELDATDAETVAYQVVFDDVLASMAHYFYNLGRQHGMETASGKT